MPYSVIDLTGVLAGIFSFSAFILYYISILRGKTIPNRATWLILTIVGIIIASSYYSVGARETIWVAVSYVLGPFITFLLSIKYGEGGWNNFDKHCLIISGVSIIIWLLSGSAIITLLINIFIDFLGILPTLKKSYLRPYSEELTPWTVTFIASLLNIVAIREWIFSIYIYPIYMLVFNTLIMLLILLPNLRSRFK